MMKGLTSQDGKKPLDGRSDLKFYGNMMNKESRILKKLHVSTNGIIQRNVEIMNGFWFYLVKNGRRAATRALMAPLRLLWVDYGGSSGCEIL